MPYRGLRHPEWLGRNGEGEEAHPFLIIKLPLNSMGEPREVAGCPGDVEPVGLNGGTEGGELGGGEVEAFNHKLATALSCSEEIDSNLACQSATRNDVLRKCSYQELITLPADLLDISPSST